MTTASHIQHGLEVAAKCARQQIFHPVRRLRHLRADFTFVGRGALFMPQRFQAGFKGSRPRTPEEIASDFWKCVTIPTDNTEQACWPWSKRVNACGYGVTSYGLAHRQVWAMKFGQVPKGMCVLHRCDNPPCCNPNHLFLGTQLDNIADMVAKRRQRAPRKLSEDDVRFIRAYHTERRVGRGAVPKGTIQYLVQKFNVDCSVICRIVQRKGKSWKNLN